jgi:hypothetical protein
MITKLDFSQTIFILTDNTRDYTKARQTLNLVPKQAFWLTSPVNLRGLFNPKVYRCGNWKALPRISEIENALVETKADVEDV